MPKAEHRTTEAMQKLNPTQLSVLTHMLTYSSAQLNSDNVRAWAQILSSRDLVETKYRLTWDIK